ncbi:MAG: hypothetical protein MHM6MM_000705 [Cercozoa sp. M6MM]
MPHGYRKSGKTLRRHGLCSTLKIARVTVLPPSLEESRDKPEFHFKGRALQIPDVELIRGGVQSVHAEPKVAQMLCTLTQKLRENDDVVDYLSDIFYIRCGTLSAYSRDTWFSVQVTPKPDSDNSDNSDSEDEDDDRGHNTRASVEISVHACEQVPDLSASTYVHVLFVAHSIYRNLSSRANHRVPDGRQLRHWAPSRLYRWSERTDRDSRVERQRLKLSVARDPLQVDADSNYTSAAFKRK